MYVARLWCVAVVGCTHRNANVALEALLKLTNTECPLDVGHDASKAVKCPARVKAKREFRKRDARRCRVIRRSVATATKGACELGTPRE